MGRSPLSALILALRNLSGPKWEPETEEFYTDGLGDLEEPLLERLRDIVVVRYDRRPSLAECLKAAAELISPTPGHAEGLEEVLALIRSRGRYGKKMPNRDIYTLGEPDDISHPLIVRVVRDLGGWETLCANEEIGVLRAQWERNFNARRAEWNEAVGRALLLPLTRRPPELFPAYEPPTLGSSFAGLIPGRNSGSHTTRLLSATFTIPALPEPPPLSEPEKREVEGRIVDLTNRLVIDRFNEAG